MVIDKLQIEKAFTEPIIRDIDLIEKIWEGEKDILKILKTINDMANKIKLIPEYADTPENRFATFIVWSVYSHTISIFQGKNKTWLDTNAKELKELGSEILSFNARLKVAFETGSYQEILDASKIYLYNLIKINDKFTLAI